MEQRTHTWIAIRAIALLEKIGDTPKLVKLLKPYVKTAAIGSWMPDLQDSKKGSGDIDNHILKMKPYNGAQKKRFTKKKSELLKLLGSKRKMYKYLKTDDKLNDNWWATPYKAEPQPGQHLGNRAMALSVTIIDLLILRDPNVAKLVPGRIGFITNVDEEARSTAAQVSTYFFMLSHFIADSCMPCHCDCRYLSSYSNGLHKELEYYWKKQIGTYFDKKKLLKNTDSDDLILDESRRIDEKFNLSFPASIPKLVSKDVWKEIVFICRASFALACILSHPSDYPYNSRKKATFDALFGSTEGQQLLSDMNQVIIHDAVLNIAVVWKHIWSKFKS